MAVSKSLPVRPSLDSLRKQAKQLARDVAAGDVAARERVRAHLASFDAPLTQRKAQLVVAREYGYAGWQELVAEVRKRLGQGLSWAVEQAERLIHDNHTQRLQQLLAEHPELLSWRRKTPDTEDSLLGFATSSYGDSFDPFSEEHFTRAACAELLIDAGAVVLPSVCEGLLRSHARGLLQLFRRKGLLPRTLPFFAALGDVDAVRTALQEGNVDLPGVTAAFGIACGFKHDAVASALLDRAIALDPDLGVQIDGAVGRSEFIGYFIANAPGHAAELGLWKAYAVERIARTISSHSGHETSVASPSGSSDLTAFLSLLEREPWLLDDELVQVQVWIIERATLQNRAEFITAFLDLSPAILRRRPPPRSQAIEFAFTYVRPHLIPLLTRIWPLPDDLPHAAGMGDLERVQRWFNESGAPALGDVDDHYPSSAYMPPSRVAEYARQWGKHSVQRVLDSAFAWSVINGHLEVAAFLLERGADINTRWSSHEPASILHELVFHANYESMKFLIDRGIDMTIRDYRWNGTAQGWAFYAAKDEKMAQWLEEAERQQKRG